MLRTTILSAILLIFSLSAFSQESDSLSFKKDIDYTAPQKYVVGGVKITGLRFLDAQTLVNLFGVDEGETIMVPGDALSKGIKKLWKQGLFSDINVSIVKVWAIPHFLT